MPKLKCVRPKWALTAAQATALLDALKLMARTMVGLAILSGIRRGELFGLRWRDIDGQDGTVTVREAVYEGHFDTPKTEAGVRRILLASGAVALSAAGKWRGEHVPPSALVC